MPISPLFLQGLAGFAQGAGERTVGIGIGSLVSSLLGWVEREATYASNRHGPTMVPELDKLIKLFYAGRIGQEDFRHELNNLAIGWNLNDVNPGLHESAWRNVITLAKPMWELGKYLRWYRMDMLYQDELYDVLAREGFTRGTTGSDPRKNDRNLELFFSDWVPPHIIECIQLLWRGKIDLPQFRQYLAAHGYWRDQEQEAYIELSKEIPGPSDLVRFAVRHVFEPTLFKRFGFDKEISPDFLAWHAKQGLGYDFTVTDPPETVPEGETPQTATINWAMAHWLAHWVWPAPTQMYEMLQRLRPGRVDPALVFTEEDLFLGLRGNDYAPNFRGRLAAISYRPPTRGDAEMAYQHGQIDQGELRERLQDVGYTPDDAGFVAKTVDNKLRFRGAERVLQRLGFQARTWLRKGVIPYDAALVLLDLTTFTGQEQIDLWLGMDATGRLAQARGNEFAVAVADITSEVGWDVEWRAGKRRSMLEGQWKNVTEQYRDGFLDRLTARAEIVQLGFTGDEADAELNLIDARQQAKLLDQGVRAIRAAFLRGDIDRPTAAGRLSALQVEADARDRYLTAWGLAMTERRRRLTATEIVGFVCNGFLDWQTALGKLQNLGYTDPDNMLWFAKAEQCIGNKQAAMQRAQMKQAAAAQKQATRIAKELEALHKQALQETTRATPLSTLKTWVKAGTITIEDFTERMAHLHYPPVIWEAWLRNICDNPKSKCRHGPADKQLTAAAVVP